MIFHNPQQPKRETPTHTNPMNLQRPSNILPYILLAAIPTVVWATVTDNLVAPFSIQTGPFSPGHMISIASNSSTPGSPYAVAIGFNHVITKKGTAIGYTLSVYADDQTVLGKYNNASGVGNELFVVGNGLSTSARSDALVVDSVGNVKVPLIRSGAPVAGKLTIGTAGLNYSAPTLIVNGQADISKIVRKGDIPNFTP